MKTAEINAKNIPILDLLLMLSSHNLKVVLMRSVIAELESLTDIDLLVSKKDKVRLTELLDNAGWLKINTSGLIMGKEVYCNYINNKLVKLDIHYELIQGGWTYGSADKAIEFSKQIKGNLWSLSDSCYLFHIAMHTIIGKPKLSHKYVARLNNINQADIAEVKLVANFSIDDELETVLQNPVEELSNQQRTSYLKKKVLKLLRWRNGNIFNQLTMRCCTKLSFLLNKRVGFSIALLGPDGAGKSTFINCLSKKLMANGFMVRSVYMGPWDRHCLRSSKLLAKIGANPLDKIAGTDSSAPKQQRILKLSKGLVRRYLYYFNLFFENWARYLFWCVPHFVKGRVVLFDRAIHDMHVGYKNKNLQNARSIRAFLIKTSFRSPFTIVLNNEAEEIWQRKKEDRLEDIAYAVDSYNELAEKYQLTVIRTNRPTEVLVDEFFAIHWREFIRLKNG